jgi:hypothetical protein
MARIRTVKPELFRHEALFEAEQKSGLPLRLAYIGIFTACDREGRFKWKPRALKLDVIPYDDVDFSRVLDALVTHGFIVKYEFEGDQFGCIPSWHTHQVINNRESTSILPSPEESTVCTCDPRVTNASTTTLVHTQAEGKGRERKGKGREGNGAVVQRPDSVSQQVWDDWLSVRKKKGASSLSQTAWDKVVSEVQISGWTFENAISECCLRNWIGFKAEWVTNSQNKPAETAYQKSQREAMEALAPGVARKAPFNPNIFEAENVTFIEGR